MYNIFGLLIGVPDYSIVVSRMEENKNTEKMMGIQIHFFFFRRLFQEKSERIRPSNDISTDVQYIWTINRSSGLQYSRESYGGKQKHGENDGHLNKHFFFLGECCLKKNQNAPRPSNDISTDVQHI